MPGKNTYHNDVYVPCKYYRKDNAIEIKCKGLCGTHTSNVFANGAAKKEFKMDFCKGNYMACPLYIALAIDDEELEI